MKSAARRWPALALFVALAGCGAATRQANVPRTAPQPTNVTFDRSFWKTDFARHSVPLASVLPGGPPPDGIPPIDHPRYVPAATAARFLAPQEPVIVLALGRRARAYPLQILIWHEIVNDALAGVPVVATYCPLC